MARDQGAYGSAANSGNQANQVFGTDWAAIQQQMQPSTKTTQALTQLPMDAANSALAGAQQSAQQRVARTNNSAGYTALADKFGRDKAQADSMAALQGQKSIQDLQNEGIKNAGNLFGIADKTQSDLYNAGSNASNASWDWTKGLNAVTDAAGTFLGTGYGKKVSGG